MLRAKRGRRYNLPMSFPKLLPAVMALFSISVAAGQTDHSGPNLVEAFKHSKPFYKQMEIGKQIVALGDPSLLQNLKDMLAAEDRHVRANAAFVFAGLGDIQGLEIIAHILEDRSYRAEGQGIGIAPGDGKYHVETQILTDRYYAVHVLGELKDARATPILIPFLKDPEIDYNAAWALGQIADKAAIAPLIVEAWKNRNPNVRVSAIHALQQLQATEALPMLHVLLEDHERNHSGSLATVAEAAKAAIDALEKK
jgi:HEAT repeat protein